jgi:hypothetical protein
MMAILRRDKHALMQWPIFRVNRLPSAQIFLLYVWQMTHPVEVLVWSALTRWTAGATLCAV